MRRILSLGLAILTLLVVFSATATAFDGGNGSEADPYQIATAEQLINLGQTTADYDKHFILTADIDLAGYTFDEAVIRSFDGVFDGNGHIINNLTIDTADADNDYLGLFGQISGTATIIKNLGMTNVVILGGTDSDYLGGICGTNNSGSIINCYVYGSIFGDNFMGGICGYNYYGSVINSYAKVDVAGYNNLGGLCGSNNHGSITNCYALGTVIGNYYGGICKYNYYGSIVNCFWDIETSGINTSDGGTGLTTAQMQDYSTFLYAGWDFVSEIANGTDDIWVMGESGYPEFLWQYPDAIITPNVINMTQADAQTAITDAGFILGDITYGYSYTVPGYSFTVPTGSVIRQDPSGIVDQLGLPINIVLNLGPTGNGSEANPYQISSAEQLIAMGSYESVFDKHFILVADIDLSAYTFTTAIIAPNIFYTNDNDQYIAFNGSFNGNDHIIRNLNINTLTDADPNNDSNDYLGLFGKTGYDAIIKNLGLENVNIIAGENSEYIGGICGYNCGEIHNSFVTGNIEGDNSGGICGINYGYFAFIAVNSNYSPPSSIFEQGIISNCYSECDVSNGICKFNDLGIINNCYTIGAKDYAICEANPAYIFRHTWYEDLGFFLRPRDVTVNIDSEISSCFWDTESSEATTSAGGTGLPTAQMQNISTYLDAGWDFAGLSINGTADIWYMPINDYPILRWQDPDADMNFIAVPDIVALTEVQWQTALTAVGLVIGDINYVYSETVQAGMIISQYPAAGQAAIVGDAVDLVVSLGKSPAIGFGNLVYANDMPDTTATLIVSFEVFNAGENTLNWQVSDPNYLNAIIAPESGNSLYPTDRTTVTATFDISMLEAGSHEVSLIISDTDGILDDVAVTFSFYIYEAIVPNIISMTQVRAQTAIADAELVAGNISYGYSPTIPSGSVISQSPSVDTYAKRGDAVDMVISLGEAPGIGLSQQYFTLNIPDTKTQETISFEVFNSGGNTLNWQINHDCPWVISVSPDTGVSSDPNNTNDQATVSVIIDTSTLNVGNYATTLMVSDVNGIIGSVPVTINLTFFNPVNLDEFALLSEYWLTDCSDPNDSCKEIDLITDGQINIADLQQLLECWMNKKVTKPFLGQGTTADPYQVSTAYQLISIGTNDNLLDKNFIMTADIDLAGYTFDHAVIGQDTDSSNITFEGYAFYGTFNGDGHIISNLTIDASSNNEDYIGLFTGPMGQNTEIKNLGLVNINITVGQDSNCVGGLCGGILLGTIDNCYVTGNISGNSYVGGLCGYSNTGNIIDSYANCSLTGNYAVGGFIGEKHTGSVKSCYCLGTVTGNDNSESIGGFCGISTRSSTDNCYSLATVSSGLNSTKIGGFCGENYQDHINYCYSIGAIVSGNGSTDIGGFCGYNFEGVFYSCFWDTETSGQTTSAGGTGLTTAAMQNIETYLNAGWDFLGETANGSEDIWQMPPAGGYPILYWQGQ
ncbi:MAG: PASTA domain-containing protein [Phycisphaerae bacterium]|nr:PASTA domain-containing protein [Phycisphaerae bacterium]